MEIKNLKKAANRISKAVKNKEKIILYGDSDLDGVASVIILKETIENLGGKISTVYFPNREKEGYGLNAEALNFLKREAPALLILLDCGISNFSESKLAKKLGFDLIIIDHHLVLDKLPEASIIIDPKQKGDKYPFKELATASLVLKLSQMLFGKPQRTPSPSWGRGLRGKEISPNLKKGFFELAALATIADMMVEVEENKTLIEEGLKSLESSFRPAFRVFSEIDSLPSYKTTRQLAQKIISTLNAATNQNHLNEAYLLLISPDLKEAKKLALKLLEKRELRQLRIREITEEVAERILTKEAEPLVFEGDSAWSLTSLGPVASKICQQFTKPTFLFKIKEKKSIGTTRTPSGINGVEAMRSCEELLETYGGHPPAAGFTVKNENLEKFKTCLIKFFSK